MPLLLDEDYERLRDCGIVIEEDASHRFLVFKNVKSGGQLYTSPECDVLVEIPPNYPQAGNDMLWTFPRLQRTDGRPIPATLEPGGDSRKYQCREFCRWSRHWTAPPNYGDVQTLVATTSKAFLKGVLRSAESGQFNARSWHYWHFRLGLAELGTVPPLPVRKLE